MQAQGGSQRISETKDVKVGAASGTVLGHDSDDDQDQEDDND